ncbi:hypothetical protein GGX14DRAFT_481423 [Mycena pura]|uniref:Uncharacterized protein n=1 Tax=Mycena pura TaxID=153505 RepID=A0AAD6XXE1_9AGAR|nr:hypothetical protein GGX14DRAFT_481423 [Mycena pura]
MRPCAACVFAPWPLPTPKAAADALGLDLAALGDMGHGTLLATFSGTDLVAFVAALRCLTDGRLTSLPLPLPLPPPPPPKVKAREVISGDDDAALYDGEPRPGQAASARPNARAAVRLRCSPIFTAGAAELARKSDETRRMRRPVAPPLPPTLAVSPWPLASRIAPFSPPPGLLAGAVLMRSAARVRPSGAGG